MMPAFSDLIDILYEDNHCIGINKPSGWPTTHFEGKDETVDRLVKSYLKEKYQKPGNVFLGVVHRLDKPVSGSLLFARTSKAAARLSEQFREGNVEKVYWAVIESQSGTSRNSWPDSGSLDDWLLHDDEEQKVRVVPAGTAGSKPARLIFQVMDRFQELILLELRPHTGRKHQLRVQLTARGHPIFGDRKYGSAHSMGDAIALHARSLTFLHPTTMAPITLQARLPRTWSGRFAHLLRSRV